MKNVWYIAPTEDACSAFEKVLEEIRQIPGETHLRLAPGRYCFHKTSSIPFTQGISNTQLYQGEKTVKHVGILLKNLSGFFLEGNGAELIFDGDMSAIAVADCRKIVLRDFSVDYLHPRVSEMRCLSASGNNLEFAVHPDSRYEIRDGRCGFLGPDGDWDAPEKRIPQCTAASGENNLRMEFDPCSEALTCREISPGKLSFSYDKKPDSEVGSIWQFRYPERNENGIMIHCSHDVELNHLHLKFTPGLGVVAQCSSDLRILHHTHAPAEKSGRACAAFADGIQISSCRGKVLISDCRFSGTQDDPINVHGTYLKAEAVCGKEITLQFYRQMATWGFLPFEAGDKVALVNPDTLERLEVRHIVHAELTDCLTVRLTLDSPFELCVQDRVVENLSAYPATVIENSVFSCYPTRGILISTAAPSIIRNNTFFQTAPYSAIRISGDARTWFESGGVTDLLIQENRFVGCTVPAILLEPENQDSYPLHSGVRVIKNSFENCVLPHLEIHSSEAVKTDLPPECCSGPVLPC